MRTRQQGSDTRKATATLRSRFTPDQKAVVIAYADRAGVTVSEYIRSQALQEPTVRARPVPSVEAQGLAYALGMLGRVSSNLYQLLKAVRFGGQFDEAEIKAVWAEIRATCRAIMEALGRKP